MFVKTLGRQRCFSKIVRLSDTGPTLNVGRCTSAAGLWLRQLCGRQRGLERPVCALAARAVLRGEEVAAATEQRGAPPLFHIVRQRVYRAET